MKYREMLDEKMNDQEFLSARIELEGEFQAMRALYTARKEQSLTQIQLAKIAHVPQKTISMIETGNSNVSVETLAKLAHALGKNLRIEFV